MSAPCRCLPNRRTPCTTCAAWDDLAEVLALCQLGAGLQRHRLHAAQAALAPRDYQREAVETTVRKLARRLAEVERKLVLMR